MKMIKWCLKKWNELPNYKKNIVRDPFSYHGTMALFNKALADCLAHEGLTNILGRPIKSYGEFTTNMLTLLRKTKIYWGRLVIILCSGEESKHGRRLEEKSKLLIPATQYTDPEGRRGVRIHFYLQGVRRRLKQTTVNWAQLSICWHWHVARIISS